MKGIHFRCFFSKIRRAFKVLLHKCTDVFTKLVINTLRIDLVERCRQLTLERVVSRTN